MAFKLNPLTGKLDLVSSESSSVQENETTFLNILSVAGVFSIFEDSSVRIINMTTTANNYIINDITINSNGELIIGNSSTLEVA